MIRNVDPGGQVTVYHLGRPSPDITPEYMIEIVSKDLDNIAEEQEKDQEEVQSHDILHRQCRN